VPFLISVSRIDLPKPKGTCGSTKLKIMAIVCQNCDSEEISYGYNIWQSLKGQFYIYLNDCDVRNVYHHLKELREMEFLEKLEPDESAEDTRSLYMITEKGRGMQIKYEPYLKILQREAVPL
jgi:DNA-binding transcriptional ArsR family regulator